MRKEIPQAKSFYFSTRDLLVMAVLAALGGVSSTYINTIGNAVQAVLGFPGATQWAAGLHTIWIVLAMGILRKTGTGTLMGLVKGAVELMSGNTHGVIILLVNLVAGLLVDFGFFLIKDKRSLIPFLVAGGLSAGSNVIVFQLFATLPSNILAMSAILILTIIATISGVIFSGFVPHYLVNTLIKANVVKRVVQPNQNRRVGRYILSGVFILAVLLTVFLRTTLQGTPTISVAGVVGNPYAFPDQTFALEKVTRQMPFRGLPTAYEGFPLLEVIAYAQPSAGADTVLIEAADGYAFLISFEELLSNPNILVVQQGQGQNASFDLVGPQSSKAWVRNVTDITLSISEGLVIRMPSGEISTFEPGNWLDEMDSTQVALPTGSQKLQGVPLWKVVASLMDDDQIVLVYVESHAMTESYPWVDIQADDHLRIFTVVGDEGITFALGTMSGEVHLYPLTAIEVAN